MINSSVWWIGRKLRTNKIKITMFELLFQIFKISSFFSSAVFFKTVKDARKNFISVDRLYNSRNRQNKLKPIKKDPKIYGCVSQFNFLF